VTARALGIHWEYDLSGGDGIFRIVQTVVETPAFLADARSLGLPEAERLAIVMWIAANPSAGDVIEGTGSARKVRFAGKARERVAATGS
jgi:hypothetical protein